MAEPRFHPGDRVWFKALATVISSHPDANAITVKEEDGAQRVIDLDCTDMELQAPAGWPPRAEDVWSMHGRRWFVIANGSAIALIDKDGNRMSAADAACCTRDLVLIDRKQNGGDRG